jgi:methyl-accepting chemotaxis protein
MLVSGVFLGVLLLVALISFESNNFAEYKSASVASERLVLNIRADVNYFSRLTRSIMLGDNYTKNSEAIAKTQKSIEGHFQNLTMSANSVRDKEKQAMLLQLIESSRKDTLLFIGDGVQKMKELGQTDMGSEARANAWNAYHKSATPLANVSRESFDKLVAFVTSYEKDMDEGLATDFDQLSFVTAAVSIALLLLLVVLSLFVYNLIKQTISDVVVNIAALTKAMVFSQKLPDRKDEFAPVFNEINKLFVSLDKSVSEANRVVLAVANADYSQRMTGEYSGDLEVLKSGVNASALSVSFMMSELEKIMEKLNLGQFDISMDNKVPNEFRRLVESSLSNISHIIADINCVVNAMSEGRFEGRVVAQAQGELSSLKTNVNQSVDAIDSLTRELLALAMAQEKGDLTVQISGSYKGRFQELQLARTASTGKIRDSISQSINASTVVNDAADQVSQGSADLSARIQEQAAALEQTSGIMNEMTNTVQANTANARKVAELTNQVQGQARDGVQVMQQTISAMQSIKESSSKINDIVTIIDSIAFQTNLLALNAAVEAARAGEHGRGFAVVASEVRALAGKSADAAKDIKNLITDSVSRIENGTQLADKSGEMLNGIAGSIQDVAGMIEEMANASNEQSVGISQVHLAIADIDKVTQENAALVEETNSAAESLSNEANHLRDNLAFFRTGVANQERRRNVSTRTAPIARAQNTSAKKPAALPSPKKSNSDEWGEF